MPPQFTWDRNKAIRNDAKHGVTFEEAATIFRDPLAFIFDDDSHSDDEFRELMIGFSDRRRLLIVSFIERTGAVRIISARKATNRERTDYKQQTR